MMNENENLTFEYKNLVKKKKPNVKKPNVKISSETKNISYLNRIIHKNNNGLKNKFKTDYLDKFPYLLPQFYLESPKYIKDFHEIQSNLKLFTLKYDNLKRILDLNKNILKIPSSGINLNCAKENNLIFQHLDFDKAHDYNYLIANKKIYSNLMEFRVSQKLYTNIVQKMFISVLNKKLNSNEIYIFTKLYNDFHSLIKKLLKHNHSLGIMGFRELFHLDIDKKQENEVKREKYVLIKGTKQKIESLKNKNKNERIEESILNYTKLYDSYNYSKSIHETEEKINTHLSSFHSITLRLSQGNYTNVYDLLNLILEQEYNLILFLLYFNDCEVFRKIYKIDNKNRAFVKRNITLFSSSKDDYMVPVTNNSSSTDLFKIHAFDKDKFFAENS